MEERFVLMLDVFIDALPGSLPISAMADTQATIEEIDFIDSNPAPILPARGYEAIFLGPKSVVWRPLMTGLSGGIYKLRSI